MIICVVITNKQMRCDSSKFKRSKQAKFSTDTGQQNVLGDVTVLQNSQLIVKSKTRFLDRNVLCIPVFANFCRYRSVVLKMNSNNPKAESTEISSLLSGYSISCVHHFKSNNKRAIKIAQEPNLVNLQFLLSRALRDSCSARLDSCST